MMRGIASLVVTLALLSACASDGSGPAGGTSAPRRTLTVFAAASLTDAFSEVADGFESAHPGLDVTFNFAGSHILRAQIEAGARADVFASANTREMETLVSGGLVTEAPQTFLTNRLVIITPADNPAGLSRFEDLARPGLKLVLAAEEVPAGRYTRQTLGKVGADFESQVLSNVVSKETDVKQVLAKVKLGEADAGIVYASDPVSSVPIKVIEIPDAFNVLAEYSIAPLADAPQPELALAFVAFVLSPQGQSILQKWGFSPVR